MIIFFPLCSRELISNASDAIEKYRYTQLTQAGSGSSGGLNLEGVESSGTAASDETAGLDNNSFFSFLFVKYHWFAWRANQWPLIEGILFSSAPPSNSLVSVSALEGLYELTRRTSRALNFSCVASKTTEKQGHNQVCRAGPRALSRTTETNLDCAFVENALFHTDPWLWKVKRIEMS